MLGGGLLVTQWITHKKLAFTVNAVLDTNCIPHYLTLKDRMINTYTTLLHTPFVPGKKERSDTWHRALACGRYWSTPAGKCVMWNVREINPIMRELIKTHSNPVPPQGPIRVVCRVAPVQMSVSSGLVFAVIRLESLNL